MLSCTKQKTQRPDNLIPEEKMVRIMADVHTVEALVEAKQLYPDTALMTYNRAKREILEKHEVSEEKFRATYTYYLENVDQMDKLYEIIIDTLSVREAKFNANNTPEPIQETAGQ
nr:DUF4296 domain-containing protein [Pontibacter harenae]